jgi:hypothetical protein
MGFQEMFRRLPLVLVLLLLQGCWLDFTTDKPLLGAKNAQDLLPARFYAVTVEPTETGKPDLAQTAPFEDRIEGDCKNGLCRLYEYQETQRVPQGELRVRALRGSYVLLQMSEDPTEYTYYIARMDRKTVPGAILFEALNLENLTEEIAAGPAKKSGTAAKVERGSDGKVLGIEVREISFFDGLVDLVEKQGGKMDAEDRVFILVKPQ